MTRRDFKTFAKAFGNGGSYVTAKMHYDVIPYRDGMTGEMLVMLRKWPVWAERFVNVEDYVTTIDVTLAMFHNWIMEG